MQFNSLYQLHAIKLAAPRVLEVAERLLFMPDLFTYWLSGAQVSELSIASTSQFYNPREKRWATELFAKLGLPEKILADIVPPGTLLGTLLPHVAEATPAVRARSTPLAATIPPRGRGGAGGGRRLGLHQLGHLVVDGRRAGRPGRQRRLAGAELHQRDRQ